MPQHCRYYSPSAAAASASAKNAVAAPSAAGAPTAVAPAAAAAAAAATSVERRWRSYFGDMLQPPLPPMPPPSHHQQQQQLQDSSSDCGTSYCTHTASTATCSGGGIVRTGWTHWTPAGGSSGYLGGATLAASRSHRGSPASCKARRSGANGCSSAADSGGEDDTDTDNVGDDANNGRARGERAQPLRSPIARPLAWLWTLLSMLVFGTCAFALVQPHWIISGAGRARGRTALGIINYCVLPQQQQQMRPELPQPPLSLPTWLSPSVASSSQQQQRRGSHADDARSSVGVGGSGGGSGGGGSGSGEEWCAYYGEHVSLSSVPSLSWRTALLTYVGGCASLAVGSLQAAFCLCVRQPHRRRLSLAAGYFQLLAVILLITSLLIYPVGLDSPVVKSACDDSGIYYGGTCHMGWSYALAIAGTALSVFCPVLSHYVDYPPGGGGSDDDDGDDGDVETAETVTPGDFPFGSPKKP